MATKLTRLQAAQRLASLEAKVNRLEKQHASLDLQVGALLSAAKGNLQLFKLHQAEHDAAAVAELDVILEDRT